MEYTPGSMKGRRAGRRSLAAPATLSRPVVHPLPSLPSATPFFPLFSPWATWSRTGRHGNPRQSRWKLNRGTLSVLSPPFFLSLYSAFSDIAFRPPSLSHFANVPTYSHPALSLSFPNYLSPHRAPSYHPAASLSSSSDRPHPLIRNPRPLALAHPRLPVARSR